MADHSEQMPLIVVQIPAYGHATPAAERWHERWRSLSKVIQHTQAQMRQAQTIARQELESFQTGWAQEHPATNGALYQQAEALLANLGDLVDDLNATTAADAARNEQALLFLSDIAHQLIPALAADQAAQVCTELLGDLHEFGETIHTFFAQALYPQPLTAPPAQSLKASLTQTVQSAYVVSERYPPDVVMATLMEQLSIDLNIVKQLFHQRYSESHDWPQRADRNEHSEALDNPQRPTLLVADQLAHLALQPALDQGFFDNPHKRVLTYLNRRVDVRLLPYHDTVLIGIPYTAQATFDVATVRQGSTMKASVLAPFAEEPSTTYTLIVPTDYLAIPHEIGHHLYRYGKQGNEPIHHILQRNLRAHLTKQPGALQSAGWRLRWLEETFADVYGCLIAGPISVFGFQEYLVHGQPIAYDQHLDKHPINVLRPLMQSQILRGLTDQAGQRIYATVADRLDARWQQWVKEHWPHWVAQQWPHGYDEATDILRDALYLVDGKTISGRALLADMQPVIDVSLQLLSDLKPANARANWTPAWTVHSNDGQAAIDSLYHAFVSFAFGATIQATLHEYRNLGAPAQPVAATVSAASPLWLEEQLTQLQQARLMRPVIEQLVDLILFAGWSTEGPRASNDQ